VNDRDDQPRFLTMIGLVALIVAVVILVFFGIGYSSDERFCSNPSRLLTRIPGLDGVPRGANERRRPLDSASFMLPYAIFGIHNSAITSRWNS